MPCIDIETAKIKMLKEILTIIQGDLHEPWDENVPVSDYRSGFMEGYEAGIDSVEPIIVARLDYCENRLTLAWEELDTHMRLGRIERGEPV